MAAPLLRNRLRSAFVLLTAGALLLLGIPLAVAVQHLLETEAQAHLQRDAARALAAIPDEALAGPDRPALPAVGTDVRLGLYDTSGSLRAGSGPGRSVLAAGARDGREHVDHEAGDLVVVAPLVSDTEVVGSVRTALPLSRLRADRTRAWLAIAALALLVLGLATVVASRWARRISRPFEELTLGATALGDGDFALALPRWGLSEADAAGDALQRTATQMGQLITQERDFVRHASHQLRTPLAGLILELEADPLAAGALERARRLDRTLTDLLVIRSTVVTGETCEPGDVVDELVAVWSRSTARTLVVRDAGEGPVTVPTAAVRQALEVLLDNAVRHGGGEICVTVEPLGDLVVVEVSDEGAGFPETAVPGTGLRLATGLVQRFGGDLLVRRRSPRPRVALLLPQASSTSKR